jgi:hypothetical protein
VAARLLQEGELRAHAVGVFGRARNAEAPHVELPPPPAQGWRALPPLPVEGPWPTFARHFEFRSEGPFPFMGASEARTEGWVRARAAGAMGSAALLAAHADAWWPAILNRMTEPRPVGTIAFTLQLLGTLEGLDPEAPFFHRARALATAEGYSMELRELWGEDGRLLALNTQTIAVIR